MTTATITRKTRTFGFDFSVDGSTNWNGPSVIGTPKQVMAEYQRIRGINQGLDSFRAAFFVDGQAISADEFTTFEIYQMIDGNADSVTVNLK